MGSSELDAYEEIFENMENGADTPPTSELASLKQESSEAMPNESISLWPKFGEVILMNNNDLTIVCDACSSKHFDLVSFKEHVMQHYENVEFVLEEEDPEVSASESAANTEVDFEEFISTAALISEPTQNQSEFHILECEAEERLDRSEQVDDTGVIMLVEDEELFVDEIDNDDFGEITELTIEVQPELADGIRKSNRARPNKGRDKPANRLVKCNACLQNFCTNFELKRHSCSGTDVAPPGCVCETCGKKFKNKNACRSHQKTHTVRERYACDQCENTYINKKTLIIHRRRHTGERPYGCMYCTESFITSTALNRHLFQHTGRKPYKCTDCDKSFATSMQLLNHSRIVHLDLRRFQCSACGKTFRTSTHLKSHYDSIHANLPRDKECEYCGSLFKTVAHLKAHMLVHEDKKYKCHICSKTFAQFPGLYGHMKRHERPNATFGPGSRLRKAIANKNKNKLNK